MRIKARMGMGMGMGMGMSIDGYVATRDGTQQVSRRACGGCPDFVCSVT